jgi:ribulose-5-phosphate 4-epimerase/fuculose-1-phosphate aldolase
MSIDDLCSDVYNLSQQLVPDGLAHGAQGNISACDRESGLVAVTPSAIPYRSMKLDDIVVTDMHGKVVKGKWNPTSEIRMHTIFYRERTDVNAVVHTHAPYASVFAITHEQIPPVLTEAACCLTGLVPVAPGSVELAEIVFDTIGGGVAVLLAQHGLLTVGPSLAEAYDSTLAAENTARLVIWARSMGAKVVTLESETQAQVRQSYVTYYHPTKSE